MAIKEAHSGVHTESQRLLQYLDAETLPCSLKMLTFSASKPQSLDFEVFCEQPLS